MKRRRALSAISLLGLLLIASIALAVVSRNQAHTLVRHPVAERDAIEKSPADYGLEHETLWLTTEDGCRLAAWYIPSRNGAAIIAQHGYKSNRQEMLNEAAMLQRHGYGVIMADLRSHGLSEGDMITFGLHEVRDLEAAYQYLLARPEVDPGRIGALGNSMGAVTALLYTAQNPSIKAVVSHSAFASMQDEVATGVEHFTGLPAFPFAPMIQFFAEREAGFGANEIAAIEHIGEISPRPVFLLQGGKDTLIPADSGQRLFEAAGEPRELWFDAELGHVEFDTKRADEYEARIVAFFDRCLLGEGQ